MDIGLREVGLLGLSALATRGVIAAVGDIASRIASKQKRLMRIESTLIANKSPNPDGSIAITAMNRFSGARNLLLVEGHIKNMQQMISLLEEQMNKIKAECGTK